MSIVNISNTSINIEDKRSEVLLELAKAIQVVAEAVTVDRRNVTGLVIYPDKKGDYE